MSSGTSVAGTVEGIFVARASRAPMEPRATIRARAGVGLDEDRYASRLGYWSPNTGVDRDLTLVEAEVIESLVLDHGIELGPGETRRNVTTRGILLNELVGRRFRIGDVECVGTRLCEPCRYLEELTGHALLRVLVHRAGLRAKILSDGTISVGDAIADLGPAEP